MKNLKTKNDGNKIVHKDFEITDGQLVKYKGKGGNVVIPDSVTEIRAYAFGGCSGLTSITIPDSVTFIEERAFSGCSGLESITIPYSLMDSDIGLWVSIVFDKAVKIYCHRKEPLEWPKGWDRYLKGRIIWDK